MVNTSEFQSYSNEFSTALNRYIDEIEKDRKILAVILFGSLSNTYPKMDLDNPERLKSDADLLFITEHVTKNNILGEPINTDQYVVNNEQRMDQKFSDHIHKADIFTQSTVVLLRNLHTFLKQIKNEQSKSLTITAGGNFQEFVFIQALERGNILRGVIPLDIKNLAHECYLEITARPNRTYLPHVHVDLVF